MLLKTWVFGKFYRLYSIFQGCYHTQRFDKCKKKPEKVINSTYFSINIFFNIFTYLYVSTNVKLLFLTMFISKASIRYTQFELSCF